MKLVDLLTTTERLRLRLAGVAPTLLRLVLGVTFLLAGWGKLHNLAGVTAYFSSLGIPAASVQAPFVSALEFGGGILLLLGLATSVVSLLLSGVMLVAIVTAIWPAQSLTGVLGSLEAIYLVALIHLGLAGGGPLTVDRLISRLRGRAPTPAVSNAA